MFRRRRLAAALAALALLPAVTASAAEDPEVPGLPLLENGTWDGVVTQGATQATKSKQWLRLPPMTLAAFIYNQPRSPIDRTCTVHPPYSNIRDFEADTVIMPAGDAKTYGRSQSFTVRSLAFGAVPVEVTLRLEQSKQADGLPEPWRVEAPIYQYCAGRGPHAGPSQNEQVSSGSLEGEVRISVERLLVDGRDLSVARGCRTADASLRLRSRTWYELDPDLRADEHPGSWDWNTSRYYLSLEGGLLEGSVDIPPFEGCTTADDDDLAPLLTGLISGPGNPVQARASSTLNYCGPKPKSSTPCPTVEPLPLPSKDD